MPCLCSEEFVENDILSKKIHYGIGEAYLNMYMLLKINTIGWDRKYQKEFTA